jgi:hypothetical protein
VRTGAEEREGGEDVLRVAGAAGAQGDRSGGQEVPRRHRHDCPLGDYDDGTDLLLLQFATTPSTRWNA